MSECLVCVEKFNKSTRKPISCPYCSTTICRSCIQQCLLQDTSARCQNVDCRKGWTHDFLYTVLTKVWMDKTYQDHCGKLFMDQEKARLPETQQDAAVYINAKAIVSDIQPRIDALTTQMRELPIVREFNTVYDIVHDIDKSREERSIAQKRMMEIRNNKEMLRAERPYRKQLKELRSEAYKTAVQHVASYGKLTVPTHEKEEKKWTFVGKCPKDTCQGFVGLDYTCGLCSVVVCKSCMEPSLDKHICDPDILLTVKAMRKEAKPCPKCAAMISKIDGCDQMWCTQCHTAFSWRTGEEETLVHNPHFYEWMRRTGQTMTPGAVRVGAAPAPAAPCAFGTIWRAYIDAICDAYPDYYKVCRSYMYHNSFRLDKKGEGPIVEKLMKLGQDVNHINACYRTYVNILAEERNIDEENKRILRVRRLANEITDTEWKVPLGRMDKCSRKYRAIHDIYDMYIQTSMNLMNEYNTATDMSDAHKQITSQYTELVTYVNEELRKIRNRFSATVNMIPSYP